MITLNVLYPNKDGAKFDMNYYLTSHIPMLKRVLGSALKGCIVEQGIGGRDPGTKAQFAVLCHLRFDSVESYQRAIGPVAEQITSVWRAVAGVITNARPTSVHDRDRERITFFAATIKDQPVDGVLRTLTNDDNRIVEITLMLRPWAALKAGLADIGERFGGQPR